MCAALRGRPRSKKMYGSTTPDHEASAPLLSSSFGEAADISGSPRTRHARYAVVALIALTGVTAVLAGGPSASKAMVRAGISLQQWSGAERRQSTSTPPACAVHTRREESPFKALSSSFPALLFCLSCTARHSPGDGKFSSSYDSPGHGKFSSS